MAGTATSGGGGAYVCRDAQGNVTSVKFVDIWEAENIPWTWDPVGVGVGTLRFDRNANLTQDEHLARAIEKLSPVDFLLAEELKKTIDQMRNSVNYLPESIDVILPPDLDVAYAPRGCPPEGIMRYNGDTKLLDVKKEYFDRISSELEWAAIWLHESIYKIFREKAEHEQSLLSRRLTACLLSSSACLGSFTNTNAIESRYIKVVYECKNEHADYYLMTDDPIPDSRNWTVLYTRVLKNKFQTVTSHSLRWDCSGSGTCKGFQAHNPFSALHPYSYAPVTHIGLEVEISKTTGELISSSIEGQVSTFPYWYVYVDKTIPQCRKLTP
jgi:hypothetical protein